MRPGDTEARGGAGRGRTAITWRTVAGLLVVSLYAWMALASGLDRLADRGEGLRLGALWPFGAGHARAAAKAALIAKAPAPALMAAREAVRRDPLDGEAIGLLGAAALASNRRVDAARAFAVAAELGWREPLAQDYLLNAALARGDVHAAADHLDAILRQAPDLPTRNLLLAPFDATPPGRRELAARLALRPAWAQAYFADTAAPEAGDPLARGEVAAMLAARGLHDCALAAPLIAGLTRHGHYDQALVTRFDHCQKATTAFPVDATFSLADTAHPPTALDWQFSDDGALDVTLSPRAGFKGRAAIVSNASSTTLPFAEQLMMLHPGRVRILWSQYAPAGAPSPAVRVALTCDAVGSPWLAEQVSDRSSMVHEVIATIPPGCPRQRLLLGIVGGASDVAVGNLQMAPADWE